MTIPAELFVLLPLALVGIAAVVLLLLVAFYRRHGLALGVTLIGLAAAGLSLPAVAPYASRVPPLLVMDGYAMFYMGLLLAAGLGVAVLAYAYLRDRPGEPEEFYILLLLATLGAMVLVASDHFASFFLGLEVLSISLYALIAYPRWREPSVEAGLKYLVLAAASASFLLFGMALVYAELGTMSLPAVAGMLRTRGTLFSDLLFLGLAMMTVGIGFKLAVVPFHLWTPDVYEGAPAPVTAFVATVSKGAVFALLLRYFLEMGLPGHPPFFWTLALIAAASMLIGNLLALRQDNVKRILAYSSIAHLGYLLVAFLAGSALATIAVTFYLTAYFVTTLGAFGVVALLSAATGPGAAGRDADRIAEYRGLAWRRPWLAGVFTTMLLSLAGIPLTAGFVGKFFVIAAGASEALWWLVFALVVGSTIGLFYYLRVIAAMYARGPAEAAALAPPVSLPLAGSAVLAVLTLLLVWLGVYPGPLLSLVQAAAAGLM